MTRRCGAGLTISGMRGTGWMAAALMTATALAPTMATAQNVTVGPGNIGPQTVASGTLTVVGGTNIMGTLGAIAPGTGILDTTGGPINITDNGNPALGVIADGGTITTVGPGPLNVTVTGVNGAGVTAQVGGSVTISGATISGTGTNMAGVLANVDGIISLTDVAVTAGGQPGGVFSGGVTLLNGGTVTGTRVTVATSDPGIPALNVNATFGPTANSASFTDSAFSSANAAAILVRAGQNQITLSGSSVTSPLQWLDVTGVSTVDIMATNSTLTGAALTAGAGSTSTLTLQGGSLWTMTGSSNLTNLTNAASTINFTPPVGDPTDIASYKTLTVVNYVGNNGTIGLNTFLGADGSPSDRLIINGGTASGLTFLNIANTVGPGALTTGSGILVVDAINGATTDDAFRLAGPVVAGPFEYLLFKGNDNPEAWYLRSTLPAPGPDPCPLPPPEGPTPPGVAPPVVPPGQTPNFRPEVSLNAALPNLALLYGRSIVGTLHDRVGDEVSLTGPAPVVTSMATGDRSGARPRATPLAEDAPAPAANGAWGRVIAEHGDRDGGCPVLVGPTFDYWFTAVQAGFDAIRLQHLSGARDRAGVYGVFGSAHADVQSQTGTDAGRDRFAAYSVGGYWTHYSAWGGYLDGLVQGTFYDVRDESTRLAALETEGWGFAASLEAGVPFKGFLGGWSIEPQAQLVYQTIDLDESGDIGARVRFEDVDSLAGRLGVRFSSHWVMPALWGLHPPLATTAWFRPSYWHEFDDDARTLFSSAIGFLPFRSNIAEDWVELNTGFTVQVDRHTALFASGSYDIDTEGDGEAWQGKVGLKVVW
jgi:outer membrane autotransporter protein